MMGEVTLSPTSRTWSCIGLLLKMSCADEHHEELAASGTFHLEVVNNEPAAAAAASWWNGQSNWHWIFLFLSLAGTYAGNIASGLLLKFYFVKGGSRRWLSCWIQYAGWPIPALATAFLYWKQGLKLTTPFTSKLLAAYTLLGCLNSFDSFLLAWGISYLPASTGYILFSSQLAFNAGFALLLTRQKITAFSWNAIVLVISSAIILALDSRQDKQAGVTKRQRILGYVVTVAASALYGLLNPLTELVFTKLLHKRSKQVVVVELQAIVGVIATLVSSIAMAINHDFSAIPREAHAFKNGEGVYYVTLFWMAISSQVAFLGTIGTIFLSSSLLAGIVLSSLIPITSIFAAIFFHDSFGGLKVMAVLLSVWGSASYLYGSYLDMNSGDKPMTAATISEDHGITPP